jgi:hypothetical protein
MRAEITKAKVLLRNGRWGTPNAPKNSFILQQTLSQDLKFSVFLFKMQIAEHFHFIAICRICLQLQHISYVVQCEHPLINLALYLERCAQEQCVHCFTMAIAFPVA